MLPLLAALPTIFSLVSKATDLFNSGKEIVGKVKGIGSIASTPEELQAEVLSLPEAQQAQWAQAMEQRIDLFAAQNQRLAIEIGAVDSNITSKVSTEAASKIALLRQTTRPWAVRMMVHYMFFPFYLIMIDLIQELANTWIIKAIFRGSGVASVKTFDYVFGPLNPGNLASIDASMLDKILTIVKDKGMATLAGQMYMEAVPWVTGIIVSYMGLRELGKIKGKTDDGASLGAALKSGSAAGQVLATAAGAGKDLVGKVRAIFRR